MTGRADLLHLTPEALTQLANAGIVKRAQRELEGGYRPEWTEEAGGTLQAAFSDGVRVTWPAATPLQHARCSCGATSVCRHRVILALAYREAAAATQAASAPEASPGAASDAELAALLPPTLLARAEAARDAGLSVDLRRRAAGEPCDTARLPAATVRFWAGASIAAARCDCVAAAACDHVALGVWAFRQADRDEPDAPTARVRLGASGERRGVERAPWEALVEAMARHGVTNGAAPVTPALSGALAAAQALGATWLAHWLQDAERWCAAYTARSALYQPEDGLALVAELSLRLRAGGLPGNAQAVLGVGQAEETELDRLRLVCLGARTTRDGEQRRTRLILADADTGTALVLPHEWKVPAADAAKEALLRGGQRLAPGVRLDGLAQGQLLARQAHRRADGTLRLARSRSSQNSVLPQVPDWSSLGPPLRYDSVAALREEQRAHPTAQVLPRHAARRFVIFTPQAVEHVGYDAGAQTVAALLRDAGGEALLVRRSHEGHLHEALDAIAGALAGRTGPPRHVAGVLHWSADLPVLDPWAIACDGIVVPDFAGAAGALAELPLVHVGEQAQHPVATALGRLRGTLAELLHHGWVQLPASWPRSCRDMAAGLRAQSLHVLAQQTDAVAATVEALQARPGEGTTLAPLLLDLAGLAQLHADALVLEALQA